MKKVLSVILAVFMVLSAVSIGVFAEAEEKVPVVILQGYSGPNLAYADENGEPILDGNGQVKLAWHMNFDDLVGKIAAALANAALSDKEVGEAIVDALQEKFEPLEMNPDGTSKYNLVPYPSGAANTSAADYKEMGLEVPESVVAEMAIAEVGEENVFGFTQDWRQSQVDSAADLDAYIQEVKAITGADRVDLYGLSHGGQYGTSYLYYYGHKGDVRRAMFGDPATTGTSAVGSFFSGEYVDVQLEDVIQFIQHGFEYEKNWEWLVDLLTIDDSLIEIMNSALVNTDLLEGIMLIPSLWDFVPYNYFENAIAYSGINAETNGKLYNDTVKYHNDISNGGLNLANRLASLEADGMKIGYVVGAGYASINGKYNSDILIDTYLSSGSVCSLWGETFEDGYVQAGTVCDNPDHYHISPEYDIDASTGFMPDNTWYVRNQGHGMIMHDEYSKNLVHDFLWGDIENVYSSMEYPQFNMSQNNGEILYARFNNTSSGYHSTADDMLVIKNMSVEAGTIIWDVKAEGADITFDYRIGVAIPKGNVFEISAVDNDFDNAKTPFKVTITYSLVNEQATYEKAEFMFTPMSDEQMERYDYLSRTAEIVPDNPTTTNPVGSQTETMTAPVFSTEEATTGSGEEGSTQESITEADKETESVEEEITGENGKGEESTTGKDEAESDEKGESQNVESTDNPNTSRSISAVVTAVAVLAGASVAIGIIVKKREE